MADVIGARIVRARQLYICKNCVKTFRPKAKDRTTYCSRECSYEHKRSRPWPRSTVWCGHCQDCGTAFVTKRKVRRCRHCRQKQAQALAAVHLCNQRWANPERACTVCRKAFIPVLTRGRRSKICSDKCRLKVRRKHTAKVHRLRKHIERARRFGVQYEAINPLAVFDRDGWRCQICGCRTPKGMRGLNKPNSPELDHRVAMSVGGSHTWANVQCACRSCNGAKGYKRTIGQLQLFSVT